MTPTLLGHCGSEEPGSSFNFSPPFVLSVIFYGTEVNLCVCTPGFYKVEWGRQGFDKGQQICLQNTAAADSQSDVHAPAC